MVRQFLAILAEQEQGPAGASHGSTATPPTTPLLPITPLRPQHPPRVGMLPAGQEMLPVDSRSSPQLCLPLRSLDWHADDPPPLTQRQATMPSLRARAVIPTGFSRNYVTAYAAFVGDNSLRTFSATAYGKHHLLRDKSILNRPRAFSNWERRPPASPQLLRPTSSPPIWLMPCRRTQQWGRLATGLMLGRLPSNPEPEWPSWTNIASTNGTVANAFAPVSNRRRLALTPSISF